MIYDVFIMHMTYLLGISEKMSLSSGMQINITIADHLDMTSLARYNVSNLF